MHHLFILHVNKDLIQVMTYKTRDYNSGARIIYICDTYVHNIYIEIIQPRWSYLKRTGFKRSRTRKFYFTKNHNWVAVIFYL